MAAEAMQRELGELVEALGEVLSEQLGANLVRSGAPLHDLAAARRAGQATAEAELCDLLAGLDDTAARAVARAYSCYFDLANLAEDRQWMRAVRERERAAHPGPRPESLAAAMQALKQAGATADEVAELLARVEIEPVFTAHPTEAKRRTNRTRLRFIRELVAELDDVGLLPRERADLARRLRAELTTLWQTDLLRLRRPTALEEVDVGLYYARTLWAVVPRLYREVAEALAAAWPDETIDLPVFLRFGSWIGGDRDGNPAVTAAVTRETLRRHRAEALELHREQAGRMLDLLTASTRQAPCSAALQGAVELAAQRYRGVREPLEPIASSELYRQWLTIIEWRLRRSADSATFGDPLVGAYLRPAELEADLELMRASLAEHGGERVADAYLDDWLWRCRVFGFHLLRLDQRQDSAVLRRQLGELLRGDGVTGYADRPEEARVAVLSRLLQAPATEPPEAVPDEAAELVELFEVLADAGELLGGQALGAFMISLCHGLSDVLGVLWLARRYGLADEGAFTRLPIVPLVETIDDLHAAPELLRGMLAHPAYAAHLAAQRKLQYVMVGYSDSTKDGGYLAAQWALYTAQQAMQAVADEFGVRLVCFHGRGGALGRGGGRAADSIRALPVGSARAGLRLTEQGEVLSERYDEPDIAHRHLEQLCAAALKVARENASRPQPAWLEAAAELADEAYRAYRRLVEQEGFADYFRAATPIDAIEALPLASRPSRRRQRRELRDLRAIPWTFAWTQSRHLLPAWFGVGAALSRHATAHGWSGLREMYHRWPFFTVLIDHAALALARVDEGVIARYAERVEPPELGRRIAAQVIDEARQCEAGLLAVMEQSSLLARIPWLDEAVARRTPYVDALCYLQIEALRRIDAAPANTPPEAREALDELVRLTIGGIAAGLRSTG